MSRYRPDPLMRGGALGDADARRLRKLAGGSAMSGGTPAVSLTRSFTDLLSAWSSDDPALLDQSRLLLLDGLAVAVAGARERGPSLMAAQARSESPDGPSTVTVRVSPRASLTPRA
jgi:hypothetical protein